MTRERNLNTDKLHVCVVGTCYREHFEISWRLYCDYIGQILNLSGNVCR